MEIKKIIDGLTLEEKARLCSGADFRRTKAVERLLEVADMYLKSQKTEAVTEDTRQGDAEHHAL